ncbi:MAG: hypothetical protein LBL52_01930 [Rickettsiales bacterium]|jgi:predicted F0F1-ATPase subunit|nr:hypothetical protein [Rickettsiales bacterium]
MDKLEKTLGNKIDRRLGAKKEKRMGVWSAVSLFGLVGWGVAAPVALFTYIGTLFKDGWITLGFMVLGFVIGIFNTARWIKREMK